MQTLPHDIISESKAAQPWKTKQVSPTLLYEQIDIFSYYSHKQRWCRPGNETRLEQPRPDALQTAGVLGMDGVVAADAGVLEHLTVVGQPRRRGGGGPPPGERGTIGRAEVDHGRTQRPRQGPYTAKEE